MNTVGTGSTVAYANLVTPFSPVGKQAVGLENAQAKEEVFAPVEESAKVSPVFNRNEQGAEAQTSVAADEQSVKSEDESSNEASAKENARKAEQEQALQDRQLISKLASRDREVRAHEQAHSAVGGQLTGSPSFTFQRGPDGVNYAVGGEVSISLPASGDDPRALLANAEKVKRAALAPADPSAQDRRVAAQASLLAVDARADIVKLNAEQSQQQADEQNVDDEKQSNDSQAVEKDQQRNDDKNREIEARRAQELADSRRRAVQVSEQFSAIGQINSEQAVGAFFDQKA